MSRAKVNRISAKIVMRNKAAALIVITMVIVVVSLCFSPSAVHGYNRIVGYEAETFDFSGLNGTLCPVSVGSSDWSVEQQRWEPYLTQLDEVVTVETHNDTMVHIYDSPSPSHGGVGDDLNWTRFSVITLNLTLSEVLLGNDTLLSLSLDDSASSSKISQVLVYWISESATNWEFYQYGDESNYSYECFDGNADRDGVIYSKGWTDYLGGYESLEISLMANLNVENGNSDRNAGSDDWWSSIYNAESTYDAVGECYLRIAVGYYNELVWFGEPYNVWRYPDVAPVDIYLGATVVDLRGDAVLSYVEFSDYMSLIPGFTLILGSGIVAYNTPKSAQYLKVVKTRGKRDIVLVRDVNSFEVDRFVSNKLKNDGGRY